MNLDPKLSSLDRTGSLIIGVGVMSYAVLGSLDQTWVHLLAIVLGMALVVGGLGGT